MIHIIPPFAWGLAAAVCVAAELPFLGFCFAVGAVVLLVLAALRAACWTKGEQP